MFSGWGVLVLPESFFVTTHTTVETYGMENTLLLPLPREGIDNSKSVYCIAEPHILHDEESPFEKSEYVDEQNWETCRSTYSVTDDPLELYTHHWHPDQGFEMSREWQKPLPTCASGMVFPPERYVLASSICHIQHPRHK